jgi:hypothetical protein
MIYFVKNKDLIIVDRLQREVNHQTVEMWIIYIKGRVNWTVVQQIGAARLINEVFVEKNRKQRVQKTPSQIHFRRTGTYVI